MSIRYILLALDAPYVKAYFDSFSRQQLFFWGGILFCALLVFKVCLGVSLIHVSGWLHNRELQDDAANVEKVSSAQLKEHRELMEQLSNIQRYTLYRGRIVG